MRTLILFALLVAGTATGAPLAPNYMLLVEGDYAVPFAQVTTTGLARLFLLADGTTDSDRIALTGHTLYGYRGGSLVGAFKVDSVLETQDDYAGGDDRVLLSPQPGADGGAVLFTTKPLAQRARPVTAPKSPTMLAAARRLVAVMLDRPEIPPRLRTLPLPADAVHAVAAARTGDPLLVVTLDGAFSDESNELGLLLVAERRAGNYVPVIQRVRWGGGECLAGWTLVDHADLDGDGVDELIVNTWNWESVRVSVLTRTGKRWGAAPEFPLPPQDGC